MKNLDNHLEEFENDPGRKIKRTTKKIIIWFVVLSALFYGINLVFSPFKSAKDVIEKTIDADNVIYNYEYFKKEYHDWLAINKKIENHTKQLEDYVKLLPENRKEWDRFDKEEFSRLQNIIIGLNDQKQDLESNYNAKSQMANRNIFKSNDLPESLGEINY